MARGFAAGTVVHYDSVPAGSDNGKGRALDGDDRRDERRRASGAGQAPPVDALQPHGRLRPRRRGARSSSAATGATSGTSTATATSTALSALFCVNIGHGRADIAQAGADQAKELGFFTNWSYAHPRAIELAAQGRLRSPPATSTASSSPRGGGEAVESALKLARQYHKLTGNPNKTKVIAREIAYHGTTLGALTATGVTGLRAPFEPFTPGGCHVPNTNLYRLPRATASRTSPRRSAHRIEFEGPETVAARDHGAGPERRRLLRAARGLLAARARDLRRVRRRCCISDEVICSWGRLGDLVRRPALRLPARHHHDGQGPDLVLRADGRDDRLRPRHRAVPRRARTRSSTASRSAGTRWPRPSRSRTSTSSRTRASSRTSARTSRTFRAMLESLRDIPIVGDVRGAGYFHAIELVKDRDTKETLHRRGGRDAAARLPQRRAVPRGLICRADDRGDPVDPARAAADRRPRAVRGDRGGPAARCSRRRRAGWLHGGRADGAAC